MKRLIDIKSFINGHINTDVARKVLKPNQFRELRNLFTDEHRAIGSKGNVLVSNPYLSDSTVYAFCGSVLDVGNNDAYFCLRSLTSSDDGIYKYDLDSDTISVVLRHTYLNFQGWVNGFAYIDGKLYWTDGYEASTNLFTEGNYNPPRKINIEKAAAYMSKDYVDDGVSVFDSLANYSEGDYVLFRKHIYQARFSVTGFNPSGTTSNNYYWTYIETYNINDNYINITRRLLDRIMWPPEYGPSLFTGEKANNEGTLIEFSEGIGDDTDREFNLMEKEFFQFCYRYVYADKEKSVFSPVSKIPLPVNTESKAGIWTRSRSLANVVALEINTGPTEVVAIEIAARSGNHGQWKLIERINKYDDDGYIVEDYPSEEEHVFLFYNDRKGEPLDQSVVEKPFDYIGQLVQDNALIEKNRLLDAAPTEGYDNLDIDIDLEVVFNKITKDTTERTFLVVFPDPTTWKIRIEIEDAVPGQEYYLKFFLKKDNWSWGSTTDVFPLYYYYVAKEGDTTTDIAEALRSAASKTLKHTISGTSPPSRVMYVNHIGYYYSEYSYISWVIAGRRPLVSNETSFPTGFFQRFGLVYLDRAKRSGAVQVSEDSLVYVPHYAEAVEDGTISAEEPIHTVSLNWEINHIPPEWATHYMWVMERVPVSYLLTFSIKGIDIVSNPDGDTFNIKLNERINNMQDAFKHCQIGHYEFNDGDRLRFLMVRKDSGSHEYFDELIDLEVLDVDYPEGEDSYQKDEAGVNHWAYVHDEKGNKIRETGVMELVVPSFDNSKWFELTDEYFIVIQVYRPVKRVADDENAFFYTFGEQYPIINPHTTSRYHGGQRSNQSYSNPATGSFERGGCYVRIRDCVIETIDVEALTYSDFYKSQITDHGKVYVIDRNASRRKMYANLRHSGQYLQNTRINNLSTFDVFDFTELSEQYGEITKIKERGYTLRVLQTGKITSIYIGRTAIYQPGEDKEEVLGTSEKVLGTQMVSPESYGCDNPESFLSTGRHFYYVDVWNGVIIWDAVNGVVPISEYGIKQEIYDLCKELLDCVSYKVYSGWDGQYNYVYFVFYGQKRSGENILKTYVFEEKGQNIWKGTLQLADANGNPPEGFVSHNNKLLSFVKGIAYKHTDEATPMNYYGDQKKPRIGLVSNNDATLVKLYKSIDLRTNVKWYAVSGDISIPPNSTNPLGMISRIFVEDLHETEGYYRAGFNRDEKTDESKSAMVNLKNGKMLKGEFIDINFEADETDVSIDEIIIYSQHSKRSGE